MPCSAVTHFKYLMMLLLAIMSSNDTVLYTTLTICSEIIYFNDKLSLPNPMLGYVN